MHLDLDLITAGVVLDYCVRRLPSLAPGDKIRILEIGSGSGGTSAVVMDALTAAAAAAAGDSATSAATAGGNGSGSRVAAPAACGSSGSTASSFQGLLERLEFVYTDISPQLVAYGRKTYGPHHPYAKFRVLDVERDVEGQVRVNTAAQSSASQAMFKLFCTVMLGIASRASWHSN